MKIFSVFCLALFSSFSQAAMMSNLIQGVGPHGDIKPYICIQNQSAQVTMKLAPGAVGDANLAAGNEYYVGATIRFGGCDPMNTYLGYVGFNLSQTGNNAVNGYSPPQGVHVTYANPSIDSMGRVSGAIKYTPIAANLALTPARASSNIWPFVGFNLSGLEFSKMLDPVVVPNLSVADSIGSSSDLSDTAAFVRAGMNTVRLPLSWGYLQLDGAGQGAINRDYYDNYVRPLLQSLTHAKTNVILDLHAYMRYSKFGEQYSGCGADGACPDGQLILDERSYQSVWGQLLTLIQQDVTIDPHYLMLDLVNEPVGVPDDKVFTIQVALIKRLREKGFNGYILVEGNAWSGLHSWTTEQWRGKDGQMYTNASLFTRENFARAGITDLSKILINVHQYLDSNYSGTHNDCLQDLTTTGTNGFNLNAFVDYLTENQLHAIVTEFGSGKNADSCRAPLNEFMRYLQDNAAKNKNSGFVGWTIWSTGHGWGDYNLRVLPKSYYMDVLKSYLF